MKLNAHLGLDLRALMCAAMCGYPTPPIARVEETTPPVAARSILVRNNSYSLLYDLLSQEKHVGKSLLIKRESSEVHRLIKDIARSAGAAAERMEAFGKRDAALALDAINLPPGEQATRKAIASTKAKELLGNSGDEFERALLFTQAQAVNYAAHLAVVAANHDADPTRAVWLNSFSETMRSYFVRCVKLMECPPRQTAHFQFTRQ